MKLIIAGSRSIQVNSEEIDELIKWFMAPNRPTEIVSGTARGVDLCGEEYAKKFGIQLKQFPADWDQYGKLAGFKRNSQMAIYADALLLIWDGQSNGSAHMKKAMNGLNKLVFEAVVKPKEG